MIETDSDTTANVVELARERSIRTPKPARVVRYCNHLPITVDSHTRTCTCRDCGATVDAFDWLLSWAKKEEGEVMAITGLRKEKEKLEADVQDLKRQRANAKSALDRALIAANKAQRGEA